MKSMCCLCIQFTHENTSERTILHQVNKKISGGGGGGGRQTPPAPPPFPGLVACTAKKASYAPAFDKASHSLPVHKLKKTKKQNKTTGFAVK